MRLDEHHGSAERVPVIELGGFLIASIQIDMTDAVATELRDELARMITSRSVHGVLIDISALDIVDSFIARMLVNIADTTRILDARTVVVGMRPPVAITLVELGLTLEGIDTAVSADQGMQLLRAATRGARAGR